MNVSSRTPEGAPHSCPLCGSQVRIEPSLPFGDAPCPSCGTLLFFALQGEEIRCYEAAAVVAHLLGISRDKVAASDIERFIYDLEADSLDVVELLMELEDSADEHE